jgi:hypothetical protein
MLRKINLPKGLGFNILILLTSIFTAVIFLEMILRLTEYRYLIYKNDVRYYYISDEILGYDIVRNFPPKIHYFGGSSHMICSNELGCFDGPYHSEKDYILLIGDSFVWGFAPSFKDNYGTLIEKYLDYRVLKCGVPGYGTRQELLKLKNILTEVRNPPKLVILGYVLAGTWGSDFTDDCLFPQRTVIDGYLVRKAANIDMHSWEKEEIPEAELEKKIQDWKKLSPQNIKYFLNSNSIIYNLIKDIPWLRKILARHGLIEDKSILAVYQIDKYRQAKQLWQTHLDNIKEIKKLCDRKGIKILIVLVPAREHVYNFFKLEDISIEKLNNLLKGFLKNEKIDYLDLTVVFRKYANQKPKKFLNSKKDLFWRYDPHWSLKGNYLAALATAKYVTEHDFLNTTSKQKVMLRIEDGFRAFNDEKK